MVMGSVRDIRNFLKKMPYTVRVGNIPGGLSEFITIQAAINYCATQTPTAANRWMVQVWPGTYDEIITMAQYVDVVGMEKDSVIFPVDSDTAVTMANDTRIANLTINVLADAASAYGIQINDASCRIEDIDMYLERNDSAESVGIIEDADNTARNIYIRNVRIRWDEVANTNTHGLSIRQANKTVYLEESYIGGSDYGVAIGTSGGGAVASTIYATLSHFEATSAVARGVFCNGGTIRLNTCNITGVDHSGGGVYRENDGIVTYKTGPREYEVWVGMSVQDAIDAAAAETTTPAAAAPYTVLIHPGIYDEAITCSSWVNLRGVGPRGSVIIYQNDNDYVIILAVNIQLQNFTIRLGTLSAWRSLVGDNGVACTVLIEDVDFEVVAPGAFEFRCIVQGAASNFTIRRCYAVIGGTGVNSCILTVVGTGTVSFQDCDWTLNNTNGFLLMPWSEATTINSKNTQWKGTAGFCSSNTCPEPASIGFPLTATCELANAACQFHFCTCQGASPSQGDWSTILPVAERFIFL
ncbi:hypothetical protein ES703_83949 [subsurface metagenome]